MVSRACDLPIPPSSWIFIDGQNTRCYVSPTATNSPATHIVIGTDSFSSFFMLTGSG